jgi:hypothetical protein
MSTCLTRNGRHWLAAAFYCIAIAARKEALVAERRSYLTAPERVLETCLIPRRCTVTAGQALLDANPRVLSRV